MLGHIHFDRSGMSNERTEILVEAKDIGKLVRNKYVRIVNPAGEDKEFLGRVVEGPFFMPEEVRRDSALAQTAILKGKDFPSVPNYYAVGGIEILGELIDGKVFGVNTRPAPQAKVFELSDDEIIDLIDISGDLLLGSLDGYENVFVHIDTMKKSVIPRNIGIFGTVGSGKSNTAQVVIEGAAQAGYAVIVLDVEGEYIEMNKPSTEEKLYGLMGKFNLTQKGMDDFQVYYPSSSSSDCEGAISFTLRSSDYDATVLAEIIGTTEPQEGALFEIIDHFKKKSKDDLTKSESDTLAELISTTLKAKPPYTLKDLVDEAYSKGGQGGQPQSTYRALFRKLARLNRSKAFDDKKSDFIQPDKLVVKGRVSIFDVADSNDTIKNLVTADLLKKIFAFKIQKLDSPKTLLVIEEAHSFISRDKSKRMTETLEMLREIARRGRKRWLGLCFISQQPAHLPEEIFELCNTRIVHNVKSMHNLQALKMTAGDVTEEMWNNCPVLGVGQAVVSTPQFRDPIVINVRPAVTKRKLVD